MKMRGFGSKRPTTSEPDDDDPSVGGGAADVQMVVLLWKNSRLLAPEAPFKVRWDKLLLLLTAYSALEFPLLWAYDIEPHAAHLVIDYLCDLFFWINLVVSARTSFLDDLGMEIVTDAKVVMKRYAKSWLVIDAFAAFPLVETPNAVWVCPSRRVPWLLFRVTVAHEEVGADVEAQKDKVPLFDDIDLVSPPRADSRVHRRSRSEPPVIELAAAVRLRDSPSGSPERSRPSLDVV